MGTFLLLISALLAPQAEAKFPQGCQQLLVQPSRYEQRKIALERWPGKTIFIDSSSLIQHGPWFIEDLLQSKVVITHQVLEELEQAAHKQGNENAKLTLQMFYRMRKESLLNTYTVEASKGTVSFLLGKDWLGLSPSEFVTKAKKYDPDAILLTENFSLLAHADLLLLQARFVDWNLLHKAHYTGVTQHVLPEKELLRLKSQKSVKVNPNYFFPNQWVRVDVDTVARFDAEAKELKLFEPSLLPKGFVYPRNIEQALYAHHLVDDEIALVTAPGSAGSGKTMLAIYYGLIQTVPAWSEFFLGEKRPRFKQVIYTRPLKQMGEQEVGTLPGDLAEKIAPSHRLLEDVVRTIAAEYLRANPDQAKTFPANFLKGPFRAAEGFDAETTAQLSPAADPTKRAILHLGVDPVEAAIRNIDAERLVKDLIAAKYLVIEVWPFVRGRTFFDSFMVVDEAQNSPKLDAMTLVTRPGEGTKIVVTGDISQIDAIGTDRLTALDENGFGAVIGAFRDRSSAAHISLRKSERSELANQAVEAMSPASDNLRSSP